MSHHVMVQRGLNVLFYTIFGLRCKKRRIILMRFLLWVSKKILIDHPIATSEILSHIKCEKGLTLVYANHAIFYWNRKLKSMQTYPTLRFNISYQTLWQRNGSLLWLSVESAIYFYWSNESVCKKQAFEFVQNQIHAINFHFS